MPKITKRFVDRVTVPAPASGKNQEFYWDTDLRGFGLRVTATGTKSYVIQYRNAAGNTKRLTLGKHGTLTADKARRLAKIKLADVAYGSDPAAAKAHARQAPTVSVLAQDYLERHAVPHKRESSVKDDRSLLERVILPSLGSNKVEAVGHRDIESLILSLRATPYKANRVRALLSKMFSLAVAWQWRSDNPVTGVLKFPEHKRERWLTEDEIGRLNTALEAHADHRVTNAIRLLLLTGARRSEVFEAEWSQFDLDEGVWIKPAHFTKQKRSERTPLSSAAIDLLRAIKKQHEEEDLDTSYVFPGNASEKPLNDIKKSWNTIRKQAGLEDVRLHDLRHTFASHLVSSGLSLPIIGRLLGHTQTQTTQRYAHLADDPLRSAADEFGRIYRQADREEAGDDT